jgi:hypothetical protein
VSAALYRSNVFGLPAADLAPRLAHWSRELLTQFTILGLPLAAVGAGLLWRERPRFALGLLATAGLYALYALGYRTADASRHFLPGLLLLAVMLGRGLRPLGWPALLLPLVIVPLNLVEVGRGDAPTIREQTESLLAQVPAGAVALTPGDATISALWYFHFVEGQRPDIRVVDANMFQFNWYRARLFNIYPDLATVSGDDLDLFVGRNASLPVCRLSIEVANVRCDEDGRLPLR